MSTQGWLLVSMIAAILMAVLFHLWWHRRQMRRYRHRL